MACTKYVKVLYTVTGHKTALMVRARCKQWSCEWCAKKNAGIWQYWLIKRLPEVSDEWWLVTLTAHSKKRTEIGSFENLRQNLDALYKRIKRVFGDIEYARVFEHHPTSGAVHVHIIMSGLAPWVANGFSVKHRPVSIGVLTRPYRDGCWSVKTWMKNATTELGMGMIADVQAFTGDLSHAAHYVTKYLTKEQQSLDIPYLRHVQVSTGIGSPQFDKNHDWTPVSYITASMFEPNTKITDLDTGEVIDNNFWEHTGYYPNE